MKEINDVLGYDNIKIFQDDDCFSFSLDSIMLANFVSLRLRDKNIADLGCGNGIIPLILSLRTKAHIVGVEIQEKLASMANNSVFYNKLEEQISIVNSDMINFATDNLEKFDVVTCNPPYFKVNEKNFFNLSQEKIIARHEVAITLSDVFSVSKRILKNNGIFAIVHRPERLLEIFDEFRKNNMEPKRLRFVYSKFGQPATMVLVEGVKNGKAGLKIDYPFILYEQDGSPTEEYETLLKEVKK